MNNSAIIAANFKTLHLDSRPVARGKEENSCFVAENRREKGGEDDQEEEEQKRRGKREIWTTHLSAGSTRWRTCSKPATEEVSYRAGAVASVEEAP